MKFLKPSELPEDTVIEVGDDRYIKMNMAADRLTPDYYWEALACGNCGWGASYSDIAADREFKAYRIVSLPYKVTADIVEAHNPRSGVPVDVAIAFMLREYNAEKA